MAVFLEINLTCHDTGNWNLNINLGRSHTVPISSSTFSKKNWTTLYFKNDKLAYNIGNQDQGNNYLYNQLFIIRH